MKIVIQIEVDDEVAASEHMDGLTDHVQQAAEYARDEFLRNEVDPQGCWCSGLSHLPSCSSWTLPY